MSIGFEMNSLPSGGRPALAWRLLAIGSASSQLIGVIHKLSLIPQDFSISRLTREKLSWIVSVLRTLESSLAAESKPRTRRTIAIGGDGLDTCERAASITIRSLVYPTRTDSLSQKDSSTLFGSLNLPKRGEWESDVARIWEESQSRTPQGRWMRRVGAVSKGGPFTTVKETDTKNWKDFSKRSTTPIRHEKCRKPSRPNS